MRKLLWMVFLLGILAGCQTESTVDDPSATHFIKFYGSDGDQTGRDLAVLPDGSMVLFGTTTPTQPTKGAQWYIVKVDAKGTIIWEKEFGGMKDEQARDIELLASGDLVLLGNTYKSATDRDAMILIVSSSTGALLDSTLVPLLNGVPSGDENVSTITELPDGTFLIAGTTTYTGPTKPDPTGGLAPGLVDTHDALKIRLNADLTVFTPWLQTYGLKADDGSAKIVPAPSVPGVYGSYYAFGYTNFVSVGTVINYNYALYVLDNLGDPANKVTYAGTTANETVSSVAAQSSSFLLSGLASNTASSFYVVETALPDEFFGFPLTEKSVSIDLGTNLSGHTACWKALVSGGYYVLGEENGFDANQNWLLTKISNSLLPEWTQPIVYGGEGPDSVGAVQELPDGRVVIIGTMRTGRPDAGEYKLTLVKVNPEGKFEK